MPDPRIDHRLSPCLTVTGHACRARAYVSAVCTLPAFSGLFAYWDGVILVSPTDVIKLSGRTELDSYARQVYNK